VRQPPACAVATKKKKKSIFLKAPAAFCFAVYFYPKEEKEKKRS
jgi:hypothetical protein